MVASPIIFVYENVVVAALVPISGVMTPSTGTVMSAKILSYFLARLCRMYLKRHLLLWQNDMILSIIMKACVLKQQLHDCISAWHVWCRVVVNLNRRTISIWGLTLIHRRWIWIQLQRPTYRYVGRHNGQLFSYWYYFFIHRMTTEPCTCSLFFIQEMILYLWSNKWIPGHVGKGMLENNSLFVCFLEIVMKW